jgi:hypothetical protein
MTMHSRVGTVLSLAVSLFTLAACGGPRTAAGACERVFDGEVCTWATVSGGAVTEFGATVPMATVESAPKGGAMTFPPVPNAIIPLPAEVAKTTGFDHLGVNWEAHGHPPALFLTPHFDFHFYTVGADRVQAIDCADSRKPTQLPAEYSLPDITIPGMGTLVGLCVPQMGMHGVPTREVEQTAPFGASMLVGYYQNNVVFLEPMISQAKLAEAKSFPMAIPPLPGTSAGIRWPSRFEAVYDPDARAYRLVFSGLPTE